MTDQTNTAPGNDGTPPGPLTVIVGPDQQGNRLDKVLALGLPDLSRSRLQALIAEGRVAVDGATIAEASLRVKPGWRVTIDLPAPEPATPTAQAMDLVVAYEDQDLIVIDKPAGLVVHPAPGNPDTTLVNALLAHCSGTLSGIGGVRRPGIVHRLDKDTSGLIVVAKNDLAHHGLAVQFAAHTVSRAYVAMVWGVPSPKEGNIEGNIGRSSSNRKKMAVVNSGGKTALTRYSVTRSFAGIAAQVECRLATGRTHQIRVHMATKGYPLIGDQTYGRTAGVARLKRHLPQGAQVIAEFPRQALHAYLLGFSHPRTGERIMLQSNLPNDLNELITTLESV
jgi:23S rRNA pseudouridine1911/1915/1917 synthase